MWVLKNEGNAVLQVFRAPMAFTRDIPNPEYGREVPDPGLDATPEQQADYLIAVALAEAEPELLTLQESEDVFTKWSDEERAAIGVIPLRQDPQPARYEAMVTGSDIQVAQDGSHAVEHWLTVAPGPEDLIALKRGEVSDKIAEVEGKFTRLQVNGTEYPVGSGRFLQMRDEDRANLTARGARAKFVLGGMGDWPNPFAWTMADNLPLPLTAQGMSDLADHADDTFALWLYVRRAKKNALLAMIEDPTKSVLDIRAFDTDGGWDHV